MATLGSNRWWRHRVDPWWTDHRSLPYRNEPFNDPKSLALWQELGYTQTKFTGDMYDMRSPEPEWIPRFRDHFPWQHFSWSVYRMAPGRVLPNHSDTYDRFKRLHSVQDDNSIVRAVIFLEDWHSGHYLEIDEVPVVNWRAGDAVVWRNDVPHLAANMGMTDRYTLQITGLDHDHTQFQ